MYNTYNYKGILKGSHNFILGFSSGISGLLYSLTSTLSNSVAGLSMDKHYLITRNIIRVFNNY